MSERYKIDRLGFLNLDTDNDITWKRSRAMLDHYTLDRLGGFRTPAGDYVRAEAYEALEREREEMRVAYHTAMDELDRRRRQTHSQEDRIDVLEREREEARERIAELERQVAALAKEPRDDDLAD